MKIRLKGTNLELTESIKDYVQTKMDLTKKYLGRVQVINCDFEVEKSLPGQNKGDIFRAEVNLQVPGELLRIEKTEKDLYKAIDKVKDHLEMSIKKYKEKNLDKHRQTLKK